MREKLSEVDDWQLDGVKPWDGFLPPSAAARIKIDPRAFAGKRVLITGAGGHIGSRLARAMQTYFRTRPEQLVLLDASEHGLYCLEQDLAGGNHLAEAALVVGSVCDENLTRELFATYRPHIVFHAAALKHVPLMEMNPLAAIETNVLGMVHVATAAAEMGAERLVLLSTDKAVDPISIMGASKRLAELIVLANRSATAMTAVRLCNVLGSSGSVAPRFVRQIEEGIAVTVTHPDVTRYFISIEDTVRLLLLAAMSWTCAPLVVPRMESPRKIADLAALLLSRAGQRAAGAGVVYTTLRRGDKLHECMTSVREQVSACDGNEALLAVESLSPDPTDLHELVLRIRKAELRRDRSELIKLICEAVPEYKPQSCLSRAGQSTDDKKS